MINPVQIGNYKIGPGNSCFIIAEAGVNHNGDVKLAHQLIDAAIKSGANAVKFQSFITEALVTSKTPKAEYQIKTTGGNSGQYKMLKSLEMSADDHAKLKDHCDQAGTLYLCTPYDNISVDMLDKIDISAFKVASTDTTNVPLLRYIASKGRPVILSTGFSSLGQVECAVESLNESGLKGKTILLQCTAEYPAPIDEINLRAIVTMQQAFGCPVGFSDHTEGTDAGPWSVAIGSCVVEKHFTLDRNMAGPDHRASLEPDEFSDLVRKIRQIERSLGDGIKRIMPSELKNKAVMQKSLVAVKAIKAGETITPDSLTCKRPGTGLSPAFYDQVVGKKADRDIEENEILTLSSIEWNS